MKISHTTQCENCFQWKIDPHFCSSSEDVTIFCPVDRKGSLLSLQRNRAVFKEFNIYHYSETSHVGQFASLLGQARWDKVNRLKSGFAAQQSAMLCQTRINLIASYGKSFSDGEFTKKCLNTFVVEMCLDEKGSLNMVSAMTCGTQHNWFYSLSWLHFLMGPNAWQLYKVWKILQQEKIFFVSIYTHTV